MTTNNPDDLIKRGDVIDAFNKWEEMSPHSATYILFAAINSIPAARSSDKGEAYGILLESGEFIKSSDLESRRIRAPLSYLEEAWKGSKLLYLAAPQQAISASERELQIGAACFIAGVDTHLASLTHHIKKPDENTIKAIIATTAAPTAPIDNGVKKHER
jgi:hypothetical protein